jgi:hypothetical protein
VPLGNCLPETRVIEKNVTVIVSCFDCFSLYYMGTGGVNYCTKFASQVLTMRFNSSVVCYCYTARWTLCKR